MNIKEWNQDDRPREKLLSNGAESLTDAELLAILLRSGNTKETAVDLARRILSSVDNDLDRLGKCSIHQLVSNFNGVGEAKAVTLLAAVELGLRRKRAEIKQRDVIRTSRQAYLLIYPELIDKPHEELWIILLNRACKVIARKRIGMGGVNETAADVRLILKEAVLSLATSVILCHNHPSGSNYPSSHDDQLTARTASLLTQLGCTLTDHLILYDQGYFSYADEGRL